MFIRPFLMGKPMKLRYLFVLGGCFFLSAPVFANIVMTGTRVIFPSESREKSIQFTNPDGQPYVVEMKLTQQDNKSEDQIPFVIVPPVFRLEPKLGQSVRLIKKGAQTLPVDRESIFYLSFTQLPAIKASDLKKNQLIIAVTSRVKIFYRPKSLTQLQSDAYKELIFSISNGRIKVVNPTGFYISISQANLVTASRTYLLVDSVMLSPKSSTFWQFNGNGLTLRRSKIKITQVNDYGAYTSSFSDLLN